MSVTMRKPDLRLAGLRRFAITISVVNLLGHTVLGFESSWAQMFVALGTAYSTEIVLETVDAWAKKRPCRFAGGGVKLIDFLLPAHIAGMAVAMLLYTGELLLPFVFAAAVAIASKALFTALVDNSKRHFLNPSNTGIVVTVFLFPALSPIMPWQFTEGLSGGMGRSFTVLVVCLGIFMNWRYSKRLPLVLAWVIAFALQGEVRCLMNHLPLIVGLVPMTGVGFVLFTFYMVTDPGSTPNVWREQVVFGAAIALIYSLLVLMHIGYGFYYALFIVCMTRGLILNLKAARLRAYSPTW
jgi:Na+-translocating ferredoxin:NAD+ oxidoreductase RnfD subunit